MAKEKRQKKTNMACSSGKSTKSQFWSEGETNLMLN